MNATNPTERSVTFAEQRIPRAQHQIYVRDYTGSEPAFVLMHGFPDNLGIYDRLAPLLAASGHRVIAFDFLYGGSDKPVEYRCSAKNMEGDLEAVINALGLTQVIPVAHDASGPTAIDWSLEHDGCVAALALMNTTMILHPRCGFLNSSTYLLIPNTERRRRRLSAMTFPRKTGRI